MSKREATAVLMWAASQWYGGAGCGIRSVPTDEQRERIREAVIRLFPDTMRLEPTEQNLSNAGFRK